MFSKYRIVAFLLLSLVLFSGCNQTTIVIPNDEASTNKVHLTLNDAILSLANQLSKNNKIPASDTGTITVTSIVNLDQLNKTSQFGRVVGESLYSELFIRGFNVTDFRGQNAISINNNGEFYITRNVSHLNSEVPNTYILVGTYSNIDGNVLINIRIMDNKTGKIVSSARAMYANDDCSMFGACNNSQRKIRIVSDDCGPFQNCHNKSIIQEIPTKKIKF